MEMGGNLNGIFTKFPKTTKKHDTIMVVVDELSKVSHFVDVKSTHIASDMAQVFIK